MHESVIDPLVVSSHFPVTEYYLQLICYYVVKQGRRCTLYNTERTCPNCEVSNSQFSFIWEGYENMGEIFRKQYIPFGKLHLSFIGGR